MLKQETKQAIADAIAGAVCFAVDNAAPPVMGSDSANHWRPIIEPMPTVIGPRMAVHIEYKYIHHNADSTGWIPL